jgi:tRNA(fMet)-specific endonuclease VapC
MACLDTSVIISILKGDESIRRIIETYKEMGYMTTTVITEYELLKHTDKVKKEIAREFINSIRIYPFDRVAAIEASKIFEKLRHFGKMINENDILIAGIAMANNELLITRDKKFNNMNNEKIIVI